MAAVTISSGFGAQESDVCRYLSVYVPLKPDLKDFELNVTSMWNEHNSMVVWTFFSIVRGMWTETFQMYKQSLEKAEEQEINLPTNIGSLEKARSSRKTSTSASLTMLKPLSVWITKNCGKSLKRWEYHTTLPVSWKSCMQVKKQHLEPDMKQSTGSKLGKEYDKAIYCCPAYLN